MALSKQTIDAIKETIKKYSRPGKSILWQKVHIGEMVKCPICRRYQYRCYACTFGPEKHGCLGKVDGLKSIVYWSGRILKFGKSDFKMFSYLDAAKRIVKYLRWHLKKKK